MQGQQWMTLVVGAFGIIGVLATLWQRQRSEHVDRRQRAEHDGRAEWCKRYQWASEQANDHTNVRAQLVGLRILGALAQSSLATASERDIIRAVAQRRHGADNGTEGEGGRE